MLIAIKKAAWFSVSFMFLQFVLLSLLLLAFFWRAPSPEGVLEWFYLLSLPSYYYVLIGLIVFLLSPLAVSAKTRPVLILPMVLLQSYVAADIFVFDVYHFHINQMLIDMFLFDLKGIGIPDSILLMAAIALLILLGINLYLLKLAQWLSHGFVLWALPGLFGVFIFSQLVHVWGNGFHQSSITQYSLYMPAYYPVSSLNTVQTIQQYFPSLVPEPGASSESLGESSRHNSGLVYPRTQLSCQPEKNNYKILLFVLESWRANMLNEQVTPNLYAFAQQSYQFNNHLSGGNVTVTGLFTLLYGLHPSYLDQVKTAPLKYRPLLHQYLDDANYKNKVYTTSNLSRFSMRPMLFGHTKDADYTYMDQLEDVADNDRQLVDILLEDILADPTDERWYRFVFLTSSHHYYYYPAEHGIFQPIGKAGGFVFDKFIEAEPFLNDYRNSLHYEDALFGEVLQALKTSGQMDNTLIVITGDHGEEFNDNNQGYWGHGSNFSRMQTGVPLIVHMPGQQQAKIITRRSAHIDIAPSLLRHGLDCEGDYSGISNGMDLFDLPEQRSVMSGSYFNRAYIIDDTVFVEEVGVKSYGLDDLSDNTRPVDYTKIRQLMEQAQSFLKH